MFQKTSTTTWIDSYTYTWGSNTGPMRGTRSISISNDDSTIYIMIDSSNTDYNPSATTAKCPLITAVDTASGSINWSNSYGWSTDFVTSGGDLSPDGSQYYFIATY